MDSFDDLRAFRDSLYHCFDRRADALLKLGDAVLAAAQVAPSPVHLSLEERGEPPAYAVEVSVCPRCHAESSPSAASTTILGAT
jgi:hypothetical protein